MQKTRKNLHAPALRPGSFAEAFGQRLLDIDHKRVQCKMSVADMCRGAKVTRSTVERWRRLIPKTIQLVDEMERVVDAKLTAKLPLPPVA